MMSAHREITRILPNPAKTCDAVHGSAGSGRPRDCKDMAVAGSPNRRCASMSRRLCLPLELDATIGASCESATPGAPNALGGGVCARAGQKTQLPTIREWIAGLRERRQCLSTEMFCARVLRFRRNRLGSGCDRFRPLPAGRPRMAGDRTAVAGREDRLR